VTETILWKFNGVFRAFVTLDTRFIYMSNSLSNTSACTAWTRSQRYRPQKRFV